MKKLYLLQMTPWEAEKFGSCIFHVIYSCFTPCCSPVRDERGEMSYASRDIMSMIVFLHSI